MRQIKFRAWDIDVKTMSPPFTWLDLASQQQWDRRTLEAINLMECVGIQDKNGIDIYECDIIRVQYPKDFDNSVTLLEGLGEIKYITHSFQLIPISKSLNDFGEYPAFIWADKSWEVVGNIYQTPELLKERTHAL